MKPTTGSEVGIRVGDLIAAKYRVDRILGVGGMGVVVAAHHLRLDELVAIKVLLPEALSDVDAVRRFEQEARSAVKIKSEHVARIIDVGSLDDGAPYIVMEYLEGEDLADRLARTGPLPVEDAIELLLQACEAIAEAHALGVVHRDLKPANLFCMLGPDGRPSLKVLDFGISKFTSVGIANSGLGMTKTTTMMGSPYYMSPEQMESPRTVDARTDIWSLGVVLYQLLTGRVPFAGDTLPQVCVNVATRSPTPLRKARPDVPSGVETIAQRCLEKDPAKRYPSIGALAAALARFGPRTAQTSLDRITRIGQNAALNADVAPAFHPHRATDRPVTGPLPSWGATANSLEKRTKNILSWSAAAFGVIAIAMTWSRRESGPLPASNGAVLVTPPRIADPTESAMVEAPLPSPHGDGPGTRSAGPPNGTGLGVASPTTTPVLPSTASEPAAPSPMAPVTRQPVAMVQPGDTARPNLAPPPAAIDQEVNPYIRAPEKTKPESEINPYIAAPEKANAANVATCLLNLNAMPAATVLVDGVPVGFTPKRAVTVAAGEHRVQFHWADGDKRQVITCASGETKTVAVRFSDPVPSEDVPTVNPYR